MSLIVTLMKYYRVVTHPLKNRLKRAQLFLVGFRAQSSTEIAWSVSADGGGKGGRIVVGKHTVLDKGVILRANGNIISIGNNSILNPYCMIQGGGGVKIGNGVNIASHSTIIAANHVFGDPAKFFYLQGESEKGIIIRDNVWIGAGAKILDGVEIGKGAVVGTGAVVTKSVEAYSVVVGIPARKIMSHKKKINPEACGT